jgi:probable phosphoglycerate mutase
MLILLLVRHALCDHVGRVIAGRTPGIHLNETGRAQAGELSRGLASLPIEAVYSGPLERAQETAEPIAQALGLPVSLASGLDELDFGTWTGQSIEELDRQPLWRAFNTFRSSTRIPGGELAGEVVARALDEAARFEREHPGAVVVAVSHGDVIRSLVAHYAGMPIDLLLRLEISPASVSAVRLEAHGPRLLWINATDWKDLLRREL